MKRSLIPANLGVMVIPLVIHGRGVMRHEFVSIIMLWITGKYMGQWLFMNGPALVAGIMVKVKGCLGIALTSSTLEKQEKIGGRGIMAGLHLGDFCRPNILVCFICAALFLACHSDKISEERVAEIAGEEISAASARFRFDCGRYPTLSEGMEALLHRPSGCESWDGPYFRPKFPVDGWGNLLYYESDSSGDWFKLFCLGRDGVKGGSGEDADFLVESMGQTRSIQGRP